jgi:hypothetical protein
VLLGDSPVDWSVIRTVPELMPWAEQRDTHAVDVINREVIAKNRRALVIYGDGHFPRKSVRSNYERDDLGPMVDRRGDNPAARIFNIYSETSTDLAKIQPDVASWTAPKFVLLKGTTLGATDFEVYAAPGMGAHDRGDDQSRPGPPDVGPGRHRSPLAQSEALDPASAYASAAVPSHNRPSRACEYPERSSMARM